MLFSKKRFLSGRTYNRKRDIVLILENLKIFAKKKDFFDFYRKSAMFRPCNEKYKTSGWERGGNNDKFHLIRSSGHCQRSYESAE